MKKLGFLLVAVCLSVFSIGVTGCTEAENGRRRRPADAAKDAADKTADAAKDAADATLRTPPTRRGRGRQRRRRRRIVNSPKSLPSPRTVRRARCAEDK